MTKRTRRNFQARTSSSSGPAQTACPVGYRFVPPLRDLHDRRLAIIGSKPRHKMLEPPLWRPIHVGRCSL